MAEGRLGRGVLAGLLVLLVAACGEPAVDVAVPAREPGQHLLDEVGLLGADIEERLREVSEGSELDVVALVFEDERSSLGQADRGGRKLLDAWDADVVLVAVGGPDDFLDDGADRQRYFGVYANDRFTVSRSLRERIIFDHVQLLAARNDWDGAFRAGIDELAAELSSTEGGG